MLLFRILTLPATMLTFCVLCSASIMTPQIVEIGSLVVWIILPIVLIGKLAIRICR